jgi:hypothetical protein
VTQPLVATHALGRPHTMLPPNEHMKLVRWSVLGLCMTAACVAHFTPAVRSQKIAPVSPPIQAHALLLLTPSFEEHLSREKNGVRQVFHDGEPAANALSALVTESFATVEIRRLADAEVPQLLSMADTSVADLLLVPSFESTHARLRLTAGDPIYIPTAIEDSLAVGAVYSSEILAEMTLRLTARSLHTGGTFTWVTMGNTGPVHTSWGRATGLALEAALHALSDSLAAHRTALEVVSPSPKF